MSTVFNTTNIAALYNEKTSRYGKSPEGLSQGSGNKTEIRYTACTPLIVADPASSVLDVGCGFGETLGYLRKTGWHGQYTGLDIAELPLQIARASFPEVSFQQGDLETALPQGKHLFDYVLGISCFTLKLGCGDSKLYYQNALRKMFDLSRKACILGGLMSTHVDFQKELAWHANPAEWYTFGIEMTRSVTICNYLPYEFVLTLRRATISQDNTFVYGS